MSDLAQLPPNAITGTDWEGRVCILRDKATGEPVRRDTVRTDFRGESLTVEWGAAPHKPSSEGVIYTNGRQLYPSTVGAEWVREPKESDKP